MPSTYAHYTFGKKVLSQLPHDIQNIAAQHETAYHIGLHGPDILFYYSPLIKNPVNRTGHRIHKEPASFFLEHAAKTIRKSGDEKSLVYILGFICHFVLDSRCHPYIEEVIKATTLSHSKIETEFDRSLMLKAGLDPLKFNPGENIVPDRSLATHIENLYVNITREQIYKSIVSMRRYIALLAYPQNIVRFIVKGLMKITGNNSSIGEMIMDKTPDLRCDNTNHKLYALYNESVSLAAELVSEYYYGIEKNSGLNEYFSHNFG
ncbi:zinc dependent phospholipase C [Anaerobacterium chartisolvens]|uniref:Zinc dependent phospholipase C n=1 Tax=Anaerobacterium chartisolvens TaxID=1297424 RepID=A0A369ALU3_9FIRM|nr:zinc dependent phospholipase C family protein [Anaerobacterium chartisolvens]RCX10340.1 zinc dependent phospholipase C [Anaerobacterium chartisolvens]